MHRTMLKVCVITATTYTAEKLLEMRPHVPTLKDPTIAKDFVINATLVLTLEKKSRIKYDKIDQIHDLKRTIK